MSETCPRCGSSLTEKEDFIQKKHKLLVCDKCNFKLLNKNGGNVK